MKSRVLRSLLAMAAMVAAVAGVWPAASVTAAPLAQANLLSNGNMESFAGNGVATGWDPWWQTIANPGNGSLNYAAVPSWIQESNKIFVQSGGLSQHIGHSWDPWHAGIRQTISVPPGSTVRITAYGRAFASTPDYPAPSDKAVQARMQIGAEPNGSIDWAAGTVKWGGQASPHDTWALFTLDVTAGAAGKITVFLSANYVGDSRYHLDTWWDNASATVTDAGTGPGPAPTSGGGNTQPTNPPPDATATGAAPAGSPAATSLPGTDATQIAQVTGTPLGTGTVCALLWNDKNGDGVRDATESLLAGGQLAVVEISTGKPVQAYTTDG